MDKFNSSVKFKKYAACKEPIVEQVVIFTTQAVLESKLPLKQW